MPSIQALEEFKSSFCKTGGELRALAELDLPYDDLPLPDHEPAEIAGSPEANEDNSAGTDFINFGDLGDLLGGGIESPVPDISGDNNDFPAAESPGPYDENFPGAEEDLSGFLDTIPDSLSADSQTAEQDFPPGLLDGFADEIEAVEPDMESSAEDSVETLGTDFEDIENQFPEDEAFSGQGISDEIFEAFPDLQSGENMELLSEEAPAPAKTEDVEDIEAFEDFAVPESTDEAAFGQDQDKNESFDFGDIPDFDSAETMDFAEDNSPEESQEFAEAEEVSELAGEEAGEEAETPLDFSAGEDGLDLGGESQDFESEAELIEIHGDSFDNFQLDNDSLAADFDIGGESGADIGDTGFGDGFDKLDDFSLPGLDVGLDKKTGGRADRSRIEQDETAEVEEINLTREELVQLQETLSSYPLNLRIACEELIVEQAVAPDQMSHLVNLLINGAPAGETAALAGKILGRTISIPKGSEKKTGEALEVEQSSFAYIFVHNFLPVLRLFMLVCMALICAGFFCWKFIYSPLKAEKIYKLGIERIDAGEYARANERFLEAYNIHKKKAWFYTYARAFRDARQYTLAEEKYQELLYFTASKNKRRIPEKAAVLEYAELQTKYIGDYGAADRIIRRNILDYYPFDREALLALGDNSLEWGEYEKERLEDARESYATLIERFGRSDPLLERMLKYFIRTDNLGEVLALQSHFMSSRNRKISAVTLAELGGYLLDKRYEEVRGVPNEYLDSISGIRSVLLRAVQTNPMLPESYYHLARYYYNFENFGDEKFTLEMAIRLFEIAKEESPKRIRYHIDTLRRYTEILIERREFFPAEENLIKGINLYQDALNRRLLSRSPEFGKLYAVLGDLEFFVKDGDLQNALDYYRLSEQNGWAPPEIQYRMGAAHYQLRQWGPALDRLFAAFREMPNRRILYAMGNVSYMRGDYFAAQGYYDRLLEILEADRARLSPIQPTENENRLDLAERLMVAQNNLGVTLEALTERTGSTKYRSRAQGLYADSERAWDILTRNPDTMIRMRPSPDITAPGVNPAYLNVQNSLHPVPGYDPQFFLRIDKDILEPSAWEDLAQTGYRLSEGIHTGR